MAKKEILRNAATGASTAAGAAAGVVIGAAVTPESAEAHEVPVDASVQAPAPSPHPEQESSSKPQPEPQPEPEPAPQQPQQEESPEVEIVGYERVTNEDGSQMDIAVVRVNGTEVGVVDADLDNEADVIVCDINNNGVIEEGEVQVVQGQGIAMNPLAEAAGFSPQFAQNDIPDYVNDANVDSFMA